MSMHPKHLAFLLILVLHCKNFNVSLASNPARFFEFEFAPRPVEPPLPPVSAPAPAPPSIEPHPPQSPPQALPAAPPPLPLPPTQGSPLTAAPGGMKGGQKAGIVVGSLAGVALVVAAGAGLVYKKRRYDATRMQLEMASMQPVFRVDSHNATPYTHLDDHAP